MDFLNLYNYRFSKIFISNFFSEQTLSFILIHNLFGEIIHKIKPLNLIWIDIILMNYPYL